MISRTKIILICVLPLFAVGLFLVITPVTDRFWPDYLTFIHSVQQGYHALLLDAVKQAQSAPPHSLSHPYWAEFFVWNLSCRRARARQNRYINLFALFR